MYLASILGFEVWSLSFSQAYLQSTTESLRKIHNMHIIPAPAEMELSADEVLEPMEPLYGLCDSGDRWAHTLRHHHTTDLGMQSLATKPALFYKCVENRLMGLSGVCTDDMQRAGKSSFAVISKSNSKRFDTSPPKSDAFRFAGVDISQSNAKNETNMDDYIRQIEIGPQNWQGFASLRAKLAWIVYVRPDICAQVAKLYQITESMFLLDETNYLKVAATLWLNTSKPTNCI